MSRATNIGKRLPGMLIYFRYLLPVLTGVTLAILSRFYLVRYYQLGSAYVQTLFNFYGNTLSASHRYLGGGEMQAGKNALYGWLSAGAGAGILCYLAGIFFAVFALVTTWRAFLTKEKGTANRMKVLFKIVFPNRVCLFLSHCLFFAPVLFPEYFSLVCRMVSGVSSQEMIYVESNPPLIVLCVLTFLTLLAAVFAKMREEKEDLNPFVLDGALPSEDEVSEAAASEEPGRSAGGRTEESAGTGGEEPSTGPEGKTVTEGDDGSFSAMLPCDRQSNPAADPPGRCPPAP